MPTIDAHDLAPSAGSTSPAPMRPGRRSLCELFGWTAAEPAGNAGGYGMLLRDGPRWPGWRPCGATRIGSTLVDVVASADADQTCAAAGGERGQGRDGRDGRARGPAAWPCCATRRGRRSRSGSRASTRLQGAGRPGTPIWSELDDARHRCRREASATRSSAGARSCRTRGVPYADLEAAASADRRCARNEQPGRGHGCRRSMVYDRDRRLRRHGAPLPWARQHGLA